VKTLQAQDRGTKLYDAYCKFLLSYNDLTTEEKSKIEGQVKAERMKVKREDQEEDCIVKVVCTEKYMLYHYKCTYVRDMFVRTRATHSLYLEILYWSFLPITVYYQLPSMSSFRDIIILFFEIYIKIVCYRQEDKQKNLVKYYRYYLICILYSNSVSSPKSSFYELGK
jgi:hypothetical protein